MRRLLALAIYATILVGSSGGVTADDAYLTYVRTAPEFRPVRQNRRRLIGRWDTWLYMPWRYRWTIGTGEAGGRFCRDYGINGGFTDHGEGPFEWLNRWNLRFYNDHTASKGYLYLRGANRHRNFQRYQRDARAIRSGTNGPQPIDEAMLRRLQGIVTRYVNNVRQHSSLCVAYALDDEISWGAFVIPLPWRLNDDDQAYAAWLKRYYGPKAAPKPQFVTPDFVRRQLDRPLGQLDFSPLLDRITYNDSVWANFIGKLVETANRAAPDTPCGFVGGQAPNLWGGYDYAKLMKKIQYLEAYDLGSAQEIARSFNPAGAMPIVMSHFHKGDSTAAKDIWQAWFYFAHGNRGIIGWVDGWFDGPKPRPWLGRFRPTLKELGGVQGPKMVGARWIHDGVALYYSHPSIQVSWCLDIQPHGATWVNRLSDARLGTSHNVRKAWEYLLADCGIQYNFLAYDQVVKGGVPDEYRVLILPACYALSDIEARRMAEFCRRGGTLIADFAAGLFDQHGRGRRKGALDDLFGVAHDGTETQADFFGERLWVETDQDKGYYYRRYRDLFATISCRLHQGYAVAERKLPVQHVRRVGRGKAVYLNLSPQRYLQYREEGTADVTLRQVFVQPVLDAGVRPPVRVLDE
ncbi:MAG: beta-galactosidase, partial [Planctomycetes bacterium]|nr:beta-galactosidase [Planctomycetota bacterium]